MTSARISRLWRTIFLAITIFSLSLPSYAKYSGGTGELNDPYRIATVPDWQTLGNTPSQWGNCFAMTADVDLRGATLSPVGNGSTQFTGVLDGQGHVILNGTVTSGGQYVGLFGYLGPGGRIRNIGVHGFMISGGHDVGGLVGYCSGSIEACSANSAVSGNEYVGGLVGYVSNAARISNCYAEGSVSGDNWVGGLVGSCWGSLTTCYSTCKVSCTDYYVGGLAGEFYVGNISACLWDTETSGLTGSAGGKGLPTAQMKSVGTFRNAQWAAGGWVMSDGQDYPRLEWENTGGVPIPGPEPVPFSGSGTLEDPYQIWSAEDFASLSWHSSVLNKHISLMTDLDLSGVTLYPIGDLGYFTGVFEGNGYTVRNAVIQQPGNDLVGLFGYVGPNARINNTGVADITIVGRRYVGGLVEHCSGNVVSCCTSGMISGSMQVGGLVGYCPGSLTSCYAMSDVNGSNYVGGLVGYCSKTGSITTCYATGSVSSGIHVGGLVGQKVHGGFTSGFWDIETSGRSGSSGGKGLMTSQMKSSVVLSNAGWGGKGWVINDGQDYPRLEWENTGGVPIPGPESVPFSGSGTLEDPYQIWSAGDFASLSWHSSVLNKHISLMTDVDLAGIAVHPIGDLGSFTGVFDGQGHVIRNVTMQHLGDYVGLFASLGQDGQICNVGVQDVNVVSGDYVGGLLGYNASGEVTSCHVAGWISGNEHVGGLIGRIYSGRVISCSAAGCVRGNADTGGLVGYNHNGRITGCYSDSVVDGSSQVGGLVGLHWGDGSLSFCYTSGSVTGYTLVGGLVGAGYGELISDCYTTSDANGVNHVGGLVGRYTNPMVHCYAAGRVTGVLAVGGLAGSGTAETTACFWDIETSGLTTSAGGTAKTTAEMQMASTFLDAGWDLVDEIENGTEDIWWIDEGQDYPRLWWELIPEN